MIAYNKHFAPGRAQTKPNDPNSKFQTTKPSTFVSVYLMSSGAWLSKWYDTLGVNVLVIEY